MHLNKGIDTMKRTLSMLVVVFLIAIGAIGDRIFNPGSDQPSTAAAATTSNPTTAAGISAASIDRVTEQAYVTTSKFVVYVESKGVGSGSGIIYDSKGDIVTNYHVVEGATSLTVTLNDGRTLPARIVGIDKADDLAVIRLIGASGLSAAHFARAGTYQVAETVLAVGSPLGLKQSVTSGLLSGLHRVEQEPNGAYLADAIQTSAPINPGNSGGALVTLDGTVVGIPTLEQTSSASGAATQDIGFAIPAERVVLIADQLIATGKVQHTGRAYLGIAPSDASGQSGGSFDPSDAVPGMSGALVSQVASGGPAARAGIQQGDVITKADGTTITSAQDLLTVLAGKKPGDTLTLTLDRSGTTVSLHVKLSEMPA
jgi:putative serine protease PepD